MKKNTKLLDQMVKSLRKMNGLKLKWGFFDEEYDDPRGVEKVSEVAQLVEEGHNNGGLFPGTTTPPRPFFKAAVESAENHRDIRAAIKKYQRKVLHGKIDPVQKLDIVGDILVKQLKESIVNFGGTIKDSTLDMRDYREMSGKDPLIEDPGSDSPSLINSVEYQIEDA